MHVTEEQGESKVDELSADVSLSTVSKVCPRPVNYVMVINMCMLEMMSSAGVAECDCEYCYVNNLIG